jgi:hypothetical protein
MKKMVKFLESSTLVSQGKNKNGMKKRRKKNGTRKRMKMRIRGLSRTEKCSAEAGKKRENLYSSPALTGEVFKGTLKISEDLFQAQQSDPRVPKIKKKRGSLYIPREP